MAGLNTRMLRRRLQASTLIEVLIAMSILLAVFGAGMLIYSNMIRSSIPQQRKEIQAQLKDLLWQYQHGQASEGSIHKDSMVYSIQTEPMPDLPDLQKVKIYADRASDNQVIDSIVTVISSQ